MNGRKVLFIGLAAALSVSSTLFAADFGLSLTDTPRYLTDDFSNTLIASPWYSNLFDAGTDLYASGSMELISDDQGTEARFDLGRTQLTLRPQDGLSLDLGRLWVADASTLVVTGLYDGLRAAKTIALGRAGAAFYYTGLRQKEMAGLVMSEADGIDSGDEDIYLAPSRVFFDLSLQSPVLIPSAALSLDLIGQFDLRSGDDSLHSQYLSAGLAKNLARDFSVKALAALALAEPGSGDAEFSSALDAELSWLMPKGPADRLYLGGLWASGSGGLGLYRPIIAPTAGKVFSPDVPGFAVARGGYFIRLRQTLSADLSGRLFLRLGEGAFEGSLEGANEDAYIGAELYGSAVFAPTSDVSFVIGTGVFIPNEAAVVPDSGVRFLATATAVISL